MKAYRIHSTPGGMSSLAAMTPKEAGDDVRRALEAGAESVDVESFEVRSNEDIEDAWGMSRLLARTDASSQEGTS